MATIPINDDTPRVQYTATASQTVFAYPFFINEDADLKVYQTLSGAEPDDTADLLTLTTHYTVDGEGTENGGDVTLVTGAASGDVITIERDIAVKRTTDYQPNGDLASTSINTDLDNLVMMVQQNETALLRNLSLKKSTQIALPFLMDDPIANYYPRIKSDLSGIAWVDVLSAGNLTVSAFIETLLDDTSAADALTTLGGASLTGDNTLSGDNTHSGDDTYTGVKDFTGASIAGASPLVFEGAAANDFETTLAITDPTADRTITVKDESGTLAYLTDVSAVTLGTSVATTSGTSIDFTSIPSDVKRINVMWQGVSTNSTSDLQIQIGTAGSPETSGYLGAVSITNSTIGTAFASGFLVQRGTAAASINHGNITLTNISGNIWVENGTYALSNTALNGVSAGSKTLAGVLDMIRLTTVAGTSTFDAGEINISYE